MTRSFRLLAMLTVSLGAACSAERPAAQPVFAETPRGSPVHFRYELVDGKGVLGSDAFRGRPTVVAFVATYDLASQAEARFLTGVLRKHGSRIHVAMIVLEPPENRPLVLAFRDALRLQYPVAMGDDALIAGEGPFGDVHAVPSVVVIDGESRMVWKHIGLSKEDEIENALKGL